jgi:Rrf2 family protein
MKLQKNSSLALYSVLEFAADPTRHISAAEIAEKYGVSAHHLAKVLNGLAHAGIVESVRGVGGGYRFIGNARRLTLIDVIQNFEQAGLPEGRPPAPDELTPVGKALGLVLSEIDEIAKATLGSITLTTMLRLMERQRNGNTQSAGPNTRNNSHAKKWSKAAAEESSPARHRAGRAAKNLPAN